MIKLDLIDNKTILTPRSGFLARPGGDITHTLQVYVGCSHSHAFCGDFCYAKKMPFQQRAFDDLAVKANAIDGYRKDYDRIKADRAARQLAIFMSTMTDPYLPQEKRVCITQSILQEMLTRPPDKLLIQTHATLIRRDLDLIVELSRRCLVMVSITVETDMERLPGFPPHASSPAERIEVLTTFRERGVLTQAAVSPLCPLADTEAFARNLEPACHRVILDHFLIGDGSRHGARTRSTGFPDKISAAGFGEWNTMEKFQETVSVFQQFFAPDRIFISAAGFTQVCWPPSLAGGQAQPISPPEPLPSPPVDFPSSPAGAGSIGPSALSNGIAVVRSRLSIVIPATARVLTTYKEFDKLIDGFLRGELSQLVIGPPGVQKSKTIEQTLDEKVCWVKGHTSAWGLYKTLYDHRDQPIVIDDVDKLYASSSAVALLKTLTEKRSQKRISWQTDRTIQDDTIPPFFITTSRAIIVANRWVTSDVDLFALEDRCLTVYFHPSPAEVHARATWARVQDPVVYTFIEDHLDSIQQLSMRLYDTAMEYRRIGMDWQRMVLDQIAKSVSVSAPDPLQVVAELLDTPFENEEQRFAAFKERTGLSKATYYRLRLQVLHGR